MNSYYLTRRSKHRTLVALSLILLAMLGFFFYVFPKVLCFQIYVLGLGFTGTYYLIRKVREEHITVSEKGVEYHSPWLIMEAKWEHVEKISYYWHNGLRVESFLIGNSQIRVKKWSFLDRGPSTSLEGFPNKTIIPLSCFSDNWRDSELGQQIKQYAPHLFEKENKQSA